MDHVDSVLLRGRDHDRYGLAEVYLAGGDRGAAAISVGSDPDSPAMSFKRRPEFPNEDAVLLACSEQRSLIAAADAHLGAESSHVLLTRLRHHTEVLPTSQEGLIEALLRCTVDQEPTEPESATTLLAAILEHGSGRAFGLSFGDSQLCVLGPEKTRWLLPENRIYVSPFRPETLRPELGSRFTVQLPAGSLLVAFSDGVHECHYREPETSIQPRHLDTLFERTGPDPARFARELTELALKGVDGNPGGQDNVVVAAVAV